MADLLDSGFVRQDDSEFSFTPQVVQLKGAIWCLDGIVLDVDKAIHVLSGRGHTARVQTKKFSYHAWIRGECNILRYDSAHNHRPYAHKHVFDPFDRGREIRIIELASEQEIPTLREVMEELRDWHEENAGRIAEYLR